MQKWEYLHVNVGFTDVNHFATVKLNGKQTQLHPKWSQSDLFEYLNKLGKEGWEIVNSEGFSYLFKRPLE